jgi:hypothetical protein
MNREEFTMESIIKNSAQGMTTFWLLKWHGFRKIDRVHDPDPLVIMRFIVSFCNWLE